MFKTTDGGNTWDTASGGLPPVGHSRALAIDPNTPDTLCAGTVRGVFKSTDAGANWNAANTGLPRRTPVTAFAIDPTTPGTFYALTVRPAGLIDLTDVFKSTDDGNTWQLATTGLPDVTVETLAVDPITSTTLYAGTRDAPTSSCGVFKSTDGGDTWRAVNRGLPSRFYCVDTLLIDPFAPSTVYAATRGGLFVIEQVCVGDCRGNGQVTIDELVTLVRIVLGTSSVSACDTGDVNHDGQITVGELIVAVNLALDDCL